MIQVLRDLLAVLSGSSGASHGLRRDVLIGLKGKQDRNGRENRCSENREEVGLFC